MKIQINCDRVNLWLNYTSILTGIVYNKLLFNINFEQMVGQIYHTELKLNKAHSSDTEGLFLDLNLSITNGTVSSKIYDKLDDFNFEIVNFLFLGGDVPRPPSIWCIYFSVYSFCKNVF